jgi:hypothetical protein
MRSLQREMADAKGISAEIPSGLAREGRCQRRDGSDKGTEMSSIVSLPSLEIRGISSLCFASLRDPKGELIEEMGRRDMRCGKKTPVASEKRCPYR